MLDGKSSNRGRVPTEAQFQPEQIFSWGRVLAEGKVPVHALHIGDVQTIQVEILSTLDRVFI